MTIAGGGGSPERTAPGTAGHGAVWEQAGEQEGATRNIPRGSVAVAEQRRWPAACGGGKAARCSRGSAKKWLRGFKNRWNQVTEAL